MTAARPSPVAMAVPAPPSVAMAMPSLPTVVVAVPVTVATTRPPPVAMPMPPMMSACNDLSLSRDGVHEIRHEAFVGAHQTRTRAARRLRAVGAQGTHKINHRDGVKRVLGALFPESAESYSSGLTSVATSTGGRHCHTQQAPLGYLHGLDWALDLSLRSCSLA